MKTSLGRWMTLAALALIAGPPARASTIVGQDCGGGNVVCNGSVVCGGPATCGNGDSLQGLFTNVGQFAIPPGTTVFVSAGVPLQIFAATITIQGHLDGSGRGFVGGIGGDPNSSGGAGEGYGALGAGAGGVASKGGGGGAYQGDGGQGAGASPGQNPGGTAYDPTALPVSTNSVTRGSGGGGGGGGSGQTASSGGQGGASIYLEGSSVTLKGNISVRGMPGGISQQPAGAGGGGGGGGLVVRAPKLLSVFGGLNASGGAGGNTFTFGGVPTAVDPGGGGGGGAVKIYYNMGVFSVIISTGGGARGAATGGFAIDDTQPPTAGAIGASTFGVVAQAPTGLAAASVFPTKIGWSWTATPSFGGAGNNAVAPAYRLYGYLSSFAAPPASAANFRGSVAAPATTLTEAGLTPNTFYSRIVTAFTDYGDSLPSNVFSTFTLAAAPASAGFVGVSTSAFQLGWSANGNPAGTVYIAQVSTSPGFTPLYASSTTLNPYAIFNSTFAGNTTFYAQVEAINGANVPTAFTPTIAAPTLADAPFGFAATQSSTYSLTFGWSSTNSTWTTHAVDLSGDGFQTVLASSMTTALSASFSGLAANTTYYARVRSFNAQGTPSAFAAPVGTFTLAAQPLNVAFPVVNPDNITASWDNGGNPPGTSYMAQLSLNNFASVAGAVVTTNLNVALGPLPVNTTTYVRVIALNRVGLPSLPSLVASTATLASQPFFVGAPFTAVGIGNLTLNWNGAGNPPGTVFGAELSDNGFVTTAFSSQTAALSASFVGLSTNTIYEGRVRAINWSGAPGAYSAPIVSTATLAQVPAPAVSPFSSISSLSITASSLPNGNPVGTSYGVQYSTASDFSGTITSQTVADNFAAFNGLGANTTYYFRARASNQFGIFTTFLNLGGVATLGDVPAGLGFVSVAQSSLTMAWSQGSNPAGTSFVAEVSSDGFFTVLSSMTVGVNATFTGLNLNGTFAARVKSRNWAGLESNYSNTVSTITGVSQPGNAAPPFFAISTNALSFAWLDGGNAPGTLYAVELSSTNFATLFSSVTTTNLDQGFLNLSPNTTYYARVKALRAGGGASPYSSPVQSGVTLAVTPVLSSFTAVNVSSVTLFWPTAGNPPGTTYLAAISIDGFVTVSATSFTVSTSATFMGLAPNVQYFAIVQPVNFAGNGGSFSNVIATYTFSVVPVNVPTPFSAVAVDGFTLTWAPGANPGGTTYEADISSTNFATLTSIATTLALSQSFAGLVANTTYYARVRAINGNGVPSLFLNTTPAAVVTGALAPAMAAQPFSAVNLSSATLSWTSGGNPSSTTYIAELSGNGFVTILSSQTANTTATFSSLLPNTTYQARVRAVNFSGAAGPYSSPIVSTSTLAAPPSALVPGVLAVSSGSVQAQWSANGNPNGTNYAIDLSTDNFATFVNRLQTSGLSRTFSALSPNTSYYAQARAVNNNGFFSANASLATGLSLSANPSVLASTTTGTVSLSTFSFTNLVSTGAGGLAYYRYVFDVSASHPFTEVETVWNGLTPVNTSAGCNGQWYLHLKSYNDASAGAAAADFGPFIISSNTPSTPGKPISNSGSFASSQLSWNWGGSLECGSAANLSYLVSIGTVPGQFNVAVDSNVGSALNFILQNPQQGLTYYARVRVVDLAGIRSAFSQTSDPVTVDLTPPTAPGVPSAPTYNYVSTVTFVWAPATAPVSGINGYRFQLGSSPGGSDVVDVTLGNTLSYTANLATSRLYYARAAAINNAGVTGAFSSASPGVAVWIAAQVATIGKPYGWPNPFNPQQGPINIGFAVDSGADVVMKVFTLEGDLVYQTSRREDVAGNKVYTWSGSSGAGRGVEPGGYIVVIQKRYQGRTDTQRTKVAVLY